MPFKFKLSKRLALIKASLAAAGVLTLACTSDLTDPQPPRNPLTQVITSTDLTPLPVASVVASGDDGNIPQNTLDNNLATRWSASSDGQWIRYDLGAVMAVGPVTIAWYRGTEWASAFDIEVSLDSLTWTRAFTGRSSGQTLQPERYDFPAVPGRYVRIVGHGQWSGTTQLSLWNSITETAIYGSAAATIKPVPVASVVASGDDGNVPQNTLDNDLATRWSASGDGQWIRYDLGAVMAVGPVNIAWYRGNEWASAFDIEVSLDAVTWTRVFTGRSSGQTLQPERYDFPVVPGRYVRIVGHGQWSGTTQLSLWNSITETAISGSATVPLDVVPVTSVVASGDDGNVPQNTLDNNLATRWSASGDGQWIRYDLGAVMAVGPVTIAWYRGTEWASAFDIEVSLDSLTWTRAFTGRSSGQTLQPERYDFPAVPGRYVRIVGHGQWSGTTQLSLWNSITETAIYGSAAATIKPVPVASVVASGDDGNVPQNTLDNDLATRWSASGDGQWIRYDLGAVMAVGPVNIAWYRGNEWASAFDIEVSLDAVTWTRVFTGRSSGQTLQPERYDFPVVPGRYVRIVGHGQWSGTTQLSLWNSITETAISGSATVPLDVVPVTSVVASGDDGNVPQNTLDNNLATRWSASGDGQWIRYDLGAVMAVGPVTIAWYRGTEWASAFDIEVSLDSLTWTRAFTGRSSGQTLQPERYDFPAVPGRYVRIVGHGQWSGTTQLGLWNSITETAIYVSAAVRIDSVPVASVTVSPSSGSARIGATVRLTGVTKDSAGDLLTRRTVSWMTSNASVATVSAGGLVTGMTAGSATITGTSEGNRGTSTITVTNVPVARVTVTPAITSLLMGATLQLTATPTDALGNPLSGRVVTWSTNTPGVATVRGTGLVTGSGVGAVAITATSEGQSGSAAVTDARTIRHRST